MFKQGSTEFELINGMQTNLVKDQIEKQANISKLGRALDLLKDAANIFDKAGMKRQASEVELVLEHLIIELDNK